MLDSEAGDSDRQMKKELLAGLPKRRKMGRIGVKLGQAVSLVEGDHSFKAASG